MTTLDACLADGEPPLPWIADLAARLHGEPVHELYTDPGVISRSLSQTAALFDLPAVCTSFDTTVAAEAAGCAVDFEGEGPSVTDGSVATIDDALAIDLDGVVDRGRVRAMAEATDRLVSTLDGTSVLGSVTGPWLLADHLLVEGVESAEPDLLSETLFTAGELLVEVANAHLDAGADGIVVLEPAGPQPTLDYEDAVIPLLNVLDHYDRAAVLVSEQLQVEGIQAAGDLGFDAVTGAVEDPEEAGREGDEAGTRVGIGVPRQTFREGPRAVREFVDEAPAGALLSSGWTIPGETDPDAVHALMGSLA